MSRTRAQALTKKRDLRYNLLRLKEADKEAFEGFMQQFLKDCNVTSPVFYKDPYEIASAEGVRRLAMSYLKVLSEDDPQILINRLEQEAQNKKHNVE